MADTLRSRLKSAWNIFRARDQTEEYMYQDLGYASTYSPNYPRISRINERSIVAAAYNRMAMDISSFDFQHVRVDEDGRYLETIDDALNQCLTVEANIDQTGRELIQDIVISMFDEGSIAVVPTITSTDPNISGSYDIYALRVAKILQWYPHHIKVDLYNEDLGVRQEVTVLKSNTAILENPLYAIMNEPNSTLKRLTRKLNLLDSVDELVSSGKIDLIIQLPYTLKSEARQKQAEERRKAIENQLRGSQYGIAYTDGTERITQLNRPAENNLLSQVQYLQKLFYNQLGISEEVFTGKASPTEMRNYYDRSIEPVVTRILEEFRRKFLTKTARTQGQSILGFRDMLRLIPADELAETADVLSRNEIATANEFRQALGLKPSNNPDANELRNKNMPIQEAPSSGGPPIGTHKGTNEPYPETFDKNQKKLDDSEANTNELK